MAAVGQQDRRVPDLAVGAGVTAAAIGVDGVPERHAGRGRHRVDDPLGVDVEELHPPELAGADVVLDDFVGIEQRRLAGRRAFLVSQLPSELAHAGQCIEHVFESWPSRPRPAPAPAARR